MCRELNDEKEEAKIREALKGLSREEALEVMRKALWPKKVI